MERVSMTRRCAECKFFHEDECRRYAPRMDYPTKKWLDIHNSELLRDIAWSMRELAHIEPPKEDDVLEDLNQEATECWEDKWPRVEQDDWCGEFVEVATPSDNSIPPLGV